jgi:CHAT domain-containing protein
VISARGATWTIGGHQEITDATSAWVLSRAYAALGAGTRLHDALREAQLAFLSHADDVESGRPPPQHFPRLPEGESDLSAPWHWALTIVGPPASAAS